MKSVLEALLLIRELANKPIGLTHNYSNQDYQDLILKARVIEELDAS